MTRTAQLIQDDRGATAIEYGLVAALIAIAIIGSLTQVAGSTTVMWNFVSGTMTTATS